MQKSQLSHDEIVAEVNKRYGHMCKRCFHTKSAHEGIHYVDRAETQWRACNYDFCNCGEFIGLSLLDLSELIEAMKEVPVKNWYDKLRSIFYDRVQD